MTRIVYKATPPTLADGDVVIPLADSAGNIKVNINAGSGLAYYNATPPTVVDAASTPLQTDVHGDLKVAVAGTNGDVADLTAAVGVYPASPATPWSYAAAASGIAATTTAVTIKAAAGASLRNYITGFSLSHFTLGNVTEFVIRDGAAGTVLYRAHLFTTSLPLTEVKFNVPLRGTADTLLEICTLSSATGGVYFNAQGFVAA